MARLVVPASQAGVDSPGYVLPEVGRLLEFLEFLELKERFGKLKPRPGRRGSRSP